MQCAPCLDNPPHLGLQRIPVTRAAMQYRVGDTPLAPSPKVIGPIHRMKVQERGMSRVPDGQNLIDPVVLAADRLAVYRGSPKHPAANSSDRLHHYGHVGSILLAVRVCGSRGVTVEIEHQDWNIVAAAGRRSDRIDVG